MDSLQEWFRYVDRVSRPARRGSGEEEDALPPWRPWMESPGSGGPEPIDPRAVADLSPAIGRLPVAEALQSASRRFEDPTLYDELRPIREFTVPDLRAPLFEVSIPSLLRPGNPAAEPLVATRDEAPGPPASTAIAIVAIVESDSERPPEGSATDAPAPPGELSDLVGAARRGELLAEMQQNSGDSGPRSRSRESREELVHRVLDPTLTLEETALFLGVCPTTVRRYTNRGQLKHFRTRGNQRRFRLSDVLEFLDSRSAEIEADARAEREAEVAAPASD